MDEDGNKAMASPKSGFTAFFSQHANKIFSFVEEYMNVLSATVIMALMFLITSDVFMRFFFNSPIAGQMEITEMLMVVSIFLGMSYTERIGGHVRMEVIILKVIRGRAQTIIEGLTCLLSLVVCGIITVYSFKDAMLSFGIVSIYLHLPLWPMRFFVPFGSFVLCIRFALEVKHYFQLTIAGKIDE